MTEPKGTRDPFDDVADVIFGAVPPSDSPVLRVVLSDSVNGRSRATSSARCDGAVVNARDLEILAQRLQPDDGADPREIAASWLQRSLAVARERYVSVTVEGAFRSPDLVVGLSRLFAQAGYATEVWAMATRQIESRIADASRRFDTHLRRDDVPRSSLDTAPIDVAAVVRGTIDATVADRLVVLDRDGGTVVDAARGTEEYEGAASAFRAAAARSLGTLRSTLLLTELRRMTHLLTEIRSTPTWAVDDLIELHELALAEIVPELPIPVDGETRRLQDERLRSTLAVLRKSRTPERPEIVTPALPEVGTSGPVVTPQQSGPGLSP